MGALLIHPQDRDYRDLKSRAVFYNCASWLERLRLKSPRWMRRLLPRGFKDLLIDLQWKLYQVDNKLLNRSVARFQKPVLLITIPKCGTHLLRSLLLLITGARWRGCFLDIATLPAREARLAFCKKRLKSARPGHVYAGHVPYEDELAAWLNEMKIARVFVYRDPRDYAVSLSHYIMTARPRLPYYEMLRGLETKGVRLMGCIRGMGDGQISGQLSSNSLPNVNLFYRQFTGWLSDPNTFSVRYEDLVSGPPDVRNHSSLAVLSKMLCYLVVLKDEPSDEALVQYLKAGLDDKKSPTFRMGKKGAWREEYAEEHVEAFKELAGDLLIELGYESNFDWSMKQKIAKTDLASC